MLWDEQMTSDSALPAEQNENRKLSDDLTAQHFQLFPPMCVHKDRSVKAELPETPCKKPNVTFE